MSRRSDGLFPIGALSDRTGCNIETIRYYERIGLLPPPVARSAGNYRLYGNTHASQLRFVRRARALGFTLEEVRALLRLTNADDSGESCAEARGLATAHLVNVRAKIADLRAMEAVLASTIKRCAVDGAQHPLCPLIETLSADVCAGQGFASGR